MPLSVILNLACIRIVGHICNRITRRMPYDELKEKSYDLKQIHNCTDSLRILRFLSANLGS